MENAGAFFGVGVGINLGVGAGGISVYTIDFL